MRGDDHAKAAAWPTGLPTRAIRKAGSGRAGILAAALCAALLPACGSSDEGAAGELVAAVGNTGTHQWAPHLAGDDTLAMYKFIHDSLTQVDKETGEIVPMLAESWDLSDDGLTWTWTLRPDVEFHDDWGTLTAEDVKFTWSEWMRDDSNQNVAETLREIVDGDIDNIEVVGDLEFKIHTPQPYTTLDSFFAHSFSRLYFTSKRYHDETPDGGDHPIGTGPWTFVSSTPGVEVVLEANEDYWGTVPSFERLVVKEIPSAAARLVQVQSGAVDIANVDSSLIGEAEAAGLRLQSVKDIGTIQMILGGMYYGHPNLDEDAPWVQAGNPEAGTAIREALSLAIDRQLIVDRVLNGEATLNYGPLLQYNANPQLVDPSWELPAYDVELARQKLAEGGYPDGFPLTIFLYPDDVDTVGIGQAVAGMWEEIGIDVTQELSDEGILDEKLNVAETDGLAWVKQQGFDPPAVALINYLSSEEDDYKFFHQAIDEGYAALIREPDEDDQWVIVRDIITALRDDTIAITLFTANLPFILGPDVGSWSPTPGDKDMNSLETVIAAE